jgi:hypothetical protein
MKQIFHILRKDLRRLWIEILLVLLAVVTSVRVNWLQTHPDPPTQWYLRDLLVTLMLFFVWWFTIARLIQEESLVGDRQFWITRPYERSKLFAAKLLFFVLVICLPYFVAIQISLKLGGAALAPNAAESIGEMLGFTVVISLPVAALATITRKISHWLIAAVGLLICFIAFAGFDSSIERSNVSAASDSVEFLEFGTFFILCATIVVIQYARRKTWASWLLMAFAIGFNPFIMAAAPYRNLLERKYVLLPSTHEPILHASVIEFSEQKEPEPLDPKVKKLYLYFPLRVSDLRQKHILDLNAVAIVIDTQDGFHWQSEWQNNSGHLYSYTATIQIPVLMDRQIYDQVHLAKSQVRLLFAVTDLEETESYKIVAKRDFDVPKFGHCWLGSLDGYVNCRTTSPSPELELLSLKSDDFHCPVAENVDRKLLPAGAIAHDLNDSSDDQIGPFHLRSFHFLQWYSPGVPAELSPRVCEGTPLTASSYKKGDHFRLDFGLGELRLANYRKQLDIFK